VPNSAKHFVQKKLSQCGIGHPTIGGYTRLGRYGWIMTFVTEGRTAKQHLAAAEPACIET
jgi:hypothetical protein